MPERLPPGHVQQGADLFKELCEHCHNPIAVNGPHSFGPNLYGLFGRKAGTLPGYERYSKPNREAEFTWTEQTMFDYLEAPKKYIPGTTMPFDGVPSKQDRCALVSYMKQAGSPSEESKDGKSVCWIQ